MGRTAQQVFDLLISPTLPGTILAVGGSIATVIVVFGISVWSICCAVKITIILIATAGK
jgi:hypothetical protein